MARSITDLKRLLIAYLCWTNGVVNAEDQKVSTVFASRTFSLAHALLKVCIMYDNVLGVQMQLRINVTMSDARARKLYRYILRAIVSTCACL